MKHVILLYWIICFSAGISCLVFFTILAAMKRDRHYGAIALFLFSFTAAIGSLTVRYYLQRIANTGDPGDMFKLMALLSMGLAVYALPGYAHHYLNPWRQKKADRMFAATALFLCLANLALFITGAGPPLAYAFYATPIVFIACVIYSMIHLLKRPPPNGRKRNAVHTVFIAVTAVLLPLFTVIDIFYNNLPFIHSLLPPGFYTLPAFYAFLSVFLTVKTLSEGGLALGGGIVITDAFIRKYNISSREKEILHLLARGMSYKETGAALFISLPTAKTHVMNIYKKTNVNSKVELINLILRDPSRGGNG
jgi:DNA-binding CsgD family transcriptional regulator